MSGSDQSDYDTLLRAVAHAPDGPAGAPDPERLAHFRIVGRLGQGGMGVVYRAEDEKLRRTVALKALPASVADDPERRRRLVREARSAAALTHPNIATVYEVGEDDGRVYIAMELVEGDSLRALIDRGRLRASASCASRAGSLVGSRARTRRASCIAISNRRT